MVMLGPVVSEDGHDGDPRARPARRRAGGVLVIAIALIALP
jgi:hypothetical protein